MYQELSLYDLEGGRIDISNLFLPHPSPKKTLIPSERGSRKLGLEASLPSSERGFPGPKLYLFTLLTLISHEDMIRLDLISDYFVIWGEEDPKIYI